MKKENIKDFENAIERMREVRDLNFPENALSLEDQMYRR